MSDVAENFRKQAMWCAEFGSRFMHELLLAALDDLEAGGVVNELTKRFEGRATPDAVALRLAGALHAGVLTGKDEGLAAAYPAAKPDWSMEEVWPLARVFLVSQQAWVAEFMTRPPQTNETGRATGLAAGFMWLADRAPQPFHMLELGASAGLNLNWDRFRFAHAPWGRTTGGGPLIPTKVTGTAPDWRDIRIESRAGCDANPLDVRDEQERLRLTAYVWPDQAARLERLDAVIRLAIDQDVHVEKADAGAWIAERVAEFKPGTTVVYHSVFYQYPPRETRHAIRDAIEAAGTRATDEQQLAWVRFEPESILKSLSGSVRYILDVVLFDGGKRTERALAVVDPHGRTMEWLGG